jgi:hypothetical protein
MKQLNSSEKKAKESKEKKKKAWFTSTLEARNCIETGEKHCSYIYT